MVHAAEIKVAAVEFNPTPKDVDGNIQKIVKLITETSNNGAKLMVLPESQLPVSVTYQVVQVILTPFLAGQLPQSKK